MTAQSSQLLLSVAVANGDVYADHTGQWSIWTQSCLSVHYLTYTGSIASFSLRRKRVLSVSEGMFRPRIALLKNNTKGLHGCGCVATDTRGKMTYDLRSPV